MGDPSVLSPLHRKTVGIRLQLGQKADVLDCRAEYVRREWVRDIRRQTSTHNRFKRLVDQWIGLAIEHSRLNMKIAERGAPG